jgi:hypothetical protein
VNANDMYHYIGKDDENNKWYVNTDPEYLTIYKNGYDFWYKIVNSKNRNISNTRVTLDSNNRTYCMSDYTNINSSKSFHQDCFYATWHSYAPGSMIAITKKYLDTSYRARNTVE